MAVADANRLHLKAMKPPAVLTWAHGERLALIIKNVEERLNDLEVE